MTILPKKKNSQQKTEGENSDPSNHSYHGDRHGHQSHPQEGRERFNFTARSSPPTWTSHSSREEKRPAHSSNSNFEDYEGADGGPSHSKRRHRASPHRSSRKTHSHTGHNLRSNNSQNFSNPGPSPSQGSHSSAQSQERRSSAQNNQDNREEDPSGYNSGDEYDRSVEMVTEEELEEKERRFEQLLRKKSLSIKKMGEDGACLFRAVADQVYGDQEMHTAVRKLCMDYMAKNSDYYSQYVTEDFEKYIQRKRCDHIHGNHIEMQAMSEMFNRRIEVYHYSAEPINIFHGNQKTDNEPIRLSYHRNVHYNSIVDPYKPTVGVGLGLPSFKPGIADMNLVGDAIRASEDLQLEQAMLEDKLRATDWEATNEAIEEQVARESYLEWLRENEMRSRKTARSATATSSSSLSDALAGSMSPQPVGHISPRTRCTTSASNSPKIHESHVEEKETKSPEKCFSPKAESSGHCGGAYNLFNGNVEDLPGIPGPASSSQKSVEKDGFPLVETATFMNQLPPSVFGLSDWEDSDILARVLAESQQEYLDSLKRTAASCTKEDNMPSS